MLTQALSPKMGFSTIAAIAAFTGLSAALPGHIQGRQTEATSTVTGYAHPLSLAPLETGDAAATPLSYASPPTAIHVSTSAAEGTSVAKAVNEEEAVDAASPVSAATTAPGAVCTSISGNYPTTTVPAFCNPSRLVNALSFASQTSSVPVATATVSAVSNKLDCCAECADIYNCVAWQYVPVHTSDPSARLPGGFDPWARGDCKLVYHTGAVDEEGGVTANGTANVCPNGRATGLLEGSANPEPQTEERWMNLYYNGWNHGACGDAEDTFVGAMDAGLGDEDTLCADPAA